MNQINLTIFQRLAAPMPFVTIGQTCFNLMTLEGAFPLSSPRDGERWELYQTNRSSFVVTKDEAAGLIEAFTALPWLPCEHTDGRAGYCNVAGASRFHLTITGDLEIWSLAGNCYKIRNTEWPAVERRISSELFRRKLALTEDQAPGRPQ